MSFLLKNRSHNHSLVQKASEQVVIPYNADSKFICEELIYPRCVAKIR